MEVGHLYYDLDIDDKNLKGSLDRADKAVKGLGHSASQYWGEATAASKKFMVGVAAVGAGIVGFGVTSVKAFQESQDVIAQTNAVLKSTGGIAGVTAKQVDELASSLQRVTKFSDEEIRSAQNMLLTFTSISKDVFPEATKTVLDMSQALGQDLKSSSIQLGKALNDPINGVTALRRVGVRFTDSQQEMINKMVESGNIMGAQKLILKELAIEFGGSATAAGQTFAGKIAQLKNNFNDLQEAIGGMLVQAAAPLMDFMAGWIAKVTEAGGLMQYLTGVFNRNRDAIIMIGGAITGALVPAVIALTLAFGRLLLILAPLMIAGAAIAYMWENNRALLLALGAGITAVSAIIFAIMLPAIIAATAAFGGMAVAVIAATWPLIAIGVAVTAVAYLIIRNFQTIKDFVIGVINTIISWWRSLPGWISGALSGVANIIIAPFRNAFDWIRNAVQGVIDAINRVKNAAGNIGGGAKNLFGGLVGKLPGFATGGIVPGPIGSPQLAIVHGGEEVIPNGGAKGNTYNFGDVNLGDAGAVGAFFDRLDRNTYLESIGVSSA